MVLLTACDAPNEYTTQATCEPTLPATIPEPLVDPIIEDEFSTTRAGLWEKLAQDDSIKWEAMIIYMVC